MKIKRKEKRLPKRLAQPTDWERLIEIIEVFNELGHAATIEAVSAQFMNETGKMPKKVMVAEAIGECLL